MGRYTTVQAYSDNNPNMRSVAYDQVAGAKGEGAKTSGSVKPEKVVNPYSSTAGAGSGEFHVYRHARAREIARLESLDREEEEDVAEQEFQVKMSVNEKEDQKRTDKRRKKRQREKDAKRRKKAMADNGLAVGKIDENDLVVDDDEFEYTPTTKQSAKQEEHEQQASKKSVVSESLISSDLNDGAVKAKVNAIPNDGSFLETMLKQMKEDGEAKVPN